MIRSAKKAIYRSCIDHVIQEWDAAAWWCDETHKGSIIFLVYMLHNMMRMIKVELMHSLVLFFSFSGFPFAYEKYKRPMTYRIFLLKKTRGPSATKKKGDTDKLCDWSTRCRWLFSWYDIFCSFMRHFMHHASCCCVIYPHFWQPWFHFPMFFDSQA